MEQYLTLDETKDLLRISKGTLMRFIRRKDNPLPTVRIGERVVRVKREDLDQWLKYGEESDSQVV